MSDTTIQKVSKPTDIDITQEKDACPPGLSPSQQE